MALKAATPILAYLDNKATMEFYTTMLGFTFIHDWDGYLIFTRDDISIHLWKCDNPVIPENTGCYINVSLVKDLYDELKPYGIIHPNGDLEDKPWGMRQFSILDNSGNILHFGEDLEEDD